MSRPPTGPGGGPNGPSPARPPRPAIDQQLRHLPAFLDETLWFPHPRTAWTVAGFEGLVAIGGDLSVPRLLLAYRSGIFPWSVCPISWWSPDPRAILELDQFHVPRSLGRTLRQGRFRVTRDEDFAGVIAGCAASAPGRRTTWIQPEFIDAYRELHAQGHAHSLECWLEDRLVGGVYGVAIGGLFAGESMFHRVPDASKVALYHLVQHLRVRGFHLFDIQMITPITRQFGAVSIPRREYLQRLAVAIECPCQF